MSTFDSRRYWDERYRNGGNSGEGSYNLLAQFKADVINEFIRDRAITSVVDYGVGDGNQAQMINTTNISYVGIDISPTAILKCRKIFAEDPTKRFLLDTQIDDLSVDLVLSCDVLYHLIEDKVYEAYVQKLFDLSRKYVIIYAADQDLNHAVHVKFRKFTLYIERYLPDWRLISHIPNRYPQTHPGRDNSTTSPSDFYIYEKQT